MDINAAFPSDFIKAADLQGREVTVTMASVELKDVGSGEMKPTLYFAGKEKGLVLNKTNANAISQMYGDQTEAWNGRQVTLFPTQTDFQGKIVPCIRVKLLPPNAVPAADPGVGAPSPAAPFAAAEDMSDSIPF